MSWTVKQLDSQQAGWCTRKPDLREYTALVVDAHYEHSRREGQLLSTAVLRVMGMRASGCCEHFGVWLGSAESQPV